ncbi:MAG: 4Fe-4S binding protein, partial [Clostridia bacterium]|nr:4Fe-4S binding protein [Clostridia bacterium]
AGQYDVHPERLDGFRHDRSLRLESEYFIRDTDKCILCGLCARACEQITGKTILGLVGRGFDTIVQPEMGLPLSETDCLSCGLCVSVCPTGALTEKQSLAKQVPVKERIEKKTCRMCPAGCHIRVATCGTALTRVLPEEGADGHVLCALGRFEQPKYMTTDIDREFYKAFDEASPFTGVLVSPMVRWSTIEAIDIIFQQYNMSGFVAAEETVKVPEAFEESRRFAIRHNFGEGTPEAEKFIADNSYGSTAQMLKDAGINVISDKQKEMLLNGQIETLIAIGVRDLPETAPDVKVIRIKAPM